MVGGKQVAMNQAELVSDDFAQLMKFVEDALFVPLLIAYEPRCSEQ